ncbi:MAG: hypothetical protein J07HX5_00467, partial [halophilic archaeon J07HX5]
LSMRSPSTTTTARNWSRESYAGAGEQLSVSTATKFVLLAVSLTILAGLAIVVALAVS